MKHFFTLSVGLCLLTSNAEEFDFGEFMANESRTHSFLIVNQNDFPLQLGKIRSSCTCSKASYEKSLLAPGESTVLTAALEANTLSGTFSKNLYLETSSAKQRFLRFTLKGKAVSLLTISPSPLRFIGTLEANRNYEYFFYLTPVKASKEILLKLVKHNFPDGATVQLKKNDTKWLLTVRLSPSPTEKEIKLNFFVKVEKPAGWPDIKFMIHGKIQNTPIVRPVSRKRIP